MSFRSSHGTGSPISFRCDACRKRIGSHRRTPKHDLGQGRADRCTFNGLSRPYRPKKGCARGSRSDQRAWHYHCNDCGHSGWSAHLDAARAAARASSPSGAPTPQP